jgi:hypothetical protein
MTTRSGPTTRDTTAIALGLAQVRVALASTYIGQERAILTVSNSLGALANTKFSGNADFYRLESGFPLQEDAIFPLRETAMLECSFKEITPKNLAIALGKDPSGYTDNHSGRIYLGTRVAPVYIRMEAVYTFPDGTNTMTIIFPRAQVAATSELDLQAEEPAASPLTIESKRADSSVSGGHVIWDGAPLGQIVWDDGTLTTTSTTTTTTA